MRRAWRPLLYGLLACLTILGVGRGLQAAIDSGSSVIYTAPDTVLMPVGTTFSAQILNALGAFTTSSSLTAAGTIAFTGIITPSQITANQDNYNPTGLATATVVRASSNASWNLTGLATGSAGALKLIYNVGSQNLVLVAESSSSTAANRFAFPGSLTLIPNAMAVLQYDGTSLRWRTSFPTLTAGPVSASWVDYTLQASDPAPPGANILRDYAKSTGKFTRDSAGNIVGPFGTGVGGGTTGMGCMTAAVASTGNLDLAAGEETIDGVTTNASIVLAKDQTNPAQNGPYTSSAGSPWARLAAYDLTAEWTNGLCVYVNGGTPQTGNKDTTWYFTPGSGFVLNTTAITFANVGLGPKGELVANRNVAGGNAGLSSEVKHIWTQNGDADTHAPIAAAGQIIPTAATMRVSGSGIVTMTTGNPRITGCTTLAMDGVELTLEGSHATNTLTMPTGNGVQLCGNTGSKIFGLHKGSTTFICNFSTTTWREANCPSLQDVANVGKDIFGASDIASAVRIGTDSNTHCRYYGKTIDCIESGAATDHEIPLAAGKSYLIKNSVGATILGVAENGTITGFARGTVVATVPLRLDTTNFANANVLITQPTRTNYDTNVIEYTETGTGCAYFTADIPANLGASPQWGIQISHSAASGGAANVFLTAAARTFGNGDAKDAALTALTLAGSPAGTVAVQTSANMNRTNLAATNFDATVALAANRLLRLSLCRVPADSNDSSTVSWFLERSPVLTLSVN